MPEMEPPATTLRHAYPLARFASCEGCSGNLRPYDAGNVDDTTDRVWCDECTNWPARSRVAATAR